jgi:hypothetical protein
MSRAAIVALVVLAITALAISAASASPDPDCREISDQPGESSTIYGTKGCDVIHALDGDDTVYGRGGVDYIYGGGGNDDLYGQDSKNNIFYGARNVLVGGSGNDRLHGWNDLRVSDRLYCGDGSDFAWKDGNDVVSECESSRVRNSGGGSN